MWIHCAYFFCILGWPSDLLLLAQFKLHWMGSICHNNNKVAWPATLTRVFYDIQMPRRHYLFKNRSLYILFHARIIWNWRLKFMLSCVKYSAGNINMFSPERPINLKKGKAHYSTQFTRLPTSSMRICWLDKKQVSDLSALTSVRIQRVSLKRSRL